MDKPLLWFSRTPVNPSLEKYSAFQKPQISGTGPSPRADKGDVSRSSRYVGTDAMAAALSGAPCKVRKGHARTPDVKSAADGEVVWSWRRDRGVHFAGGLPQTTVTTNAAHRGEH